MISFKSSITATNKSLRPEDLQLLILSRINNIISNKPQINLTMMTLVDSKIRMIKSNNYFNNSRRPSAICLVRVNCLQLISISITTIRNQTIKTASIDLILNTFNINRICLFSNRLLFTRAQTLTN